MALCAPANTTWLIRRLHSFAEPLHTVTMPAASATSGGPRKTSNAAPPRPTTSTRPAIATTLHARASLRVVGTADDPRAPVRTRRKTSRRPRKTSRRPTTAMTPVAARLGAAAAYAPAASKSTARAICADGRSGAVSHRQSALPRANGSTTSSMVDPAAANTTPAEPAMSASGFTGPKYATHRPWTTPRGPEDATDECPYLDEACERPLRLR